MSWLSSTNNDCQGTGHTEATSCLTFSSLFLLIFLFITKDNGIVCEVFCPFWQQKLSLKLHLDQNRAGIALKASLFLQKPFLDSQPLRLPPKQSPYQEPSWKILTCNSPPPNPETRLTCAACKCLSLKAEHCQQLPSCVQSMTFQTISQQV